MRLGSLGTLKALQVDDQPKETSPPQYLRIVRMYNSLLCTPLFSRLRPRLIDIVSARPEDLAAVVSPRPASVSASRFRNPSKNRLGLCSVLSRASSLASEHAVWVALIRSSLLRFCDPTQYVSADVGENSTGRWGTPTYTSAARYGEVTVVQQAAAVSVLEQTAAGDTRTDLSGCRGPTRLQAVSHLVNGESVLGSSMLLAATGNQSKTISWPSTGPRNMRSLVHVQIPVGTRTK
jgi:hypothetical protein